MQVSGQLPPLVPGASLSVRRDAPGCRSSATGAQAGHGEAQTPELLCVPIPGTQVPLPVKVKKWVRPP